MALEEIKVKQRQVPAEKSPTHLDTLKEGLATYNAIQKRVEFNVQESPNKRCCRLVYNQKSKKGMHFFEADGVTRTIWGLICGSREDCINKAKELGIDMSQAEQNQELEESK
jgi:hypothetical protein